MCVCPGVDNGDQVEVQFAVPGKKGQTRVLIPVEVEPHPVFRREGADVHITLQLKLSQVIVLLVVAILSCCRSC